MKKIFRMNNKVTGATLFVVSAFLQRGLSLLTTPVYTRILTPYDFGIVATYSTWYGVLSVIFTLSIAANAFNTGLIRYKSERDSFVSNMITLTASSVFFGFCIISVLKVNVANLSGLEYKYFVIMFINMFCDVIYGFWGLCSKFDEKYCKFVVINLLISITSILLSITSLLFINGDKAFVKIISDSVIGSIFAIYIAIYYVKKCPRIMVKKYWLYAISFCVPLIPHYLSNHLLNQADRMMITYFCGTDKTGLYSIAYKIPEILNVCWSCVSAVYIPWLYKKLDSNNQNEVRKWNGIIVVSISVITFCVILLAPEIMMILAAEEYYEAVYIVPVLMAGYLGLFCCLLCSHIELFFQKNKFITLITIIATVINIVLNYLAIPVLGYVAASYTTFLGYAIMLLLHIYNLKRLKLTQFLNTKLIVLFFVLNSILAIGLLTLYGNRTVRFYIFGAVFTFCLVNQKKIMLSIKYLRNK